MKWLLITTSKRTPDTLGSNVGDEFARLGIQRLISAVDSKAEWDLLDKEKDDAWKPRAFDKAVVCGMPLFWSLPAQDFPWRQSCQNVWWWPRLLRGWASAVRENFLVMGVGHVFVDRIVSLLDYANAIQECIDRAWALVVREPVIDHPRIVDTVCPSAFCLYDRGEKRTLRCCNLMAIGGHFGHLTPDGEAWAKQVQAIADVLKKRDFHFIAHTQTERRLALDLGFHHERVHIYGSAREYLDTYAKCERYFGNRLHGAAVVASTGAPVWACSHDSRLGMVRRLGGKTTRTPEATPEAVAAWADATLPPSVSQYPLGAEYLRMVALMKSFADATAKQPWTE